MRLCAFSAAAVLAALTAMPAKSQPVAKAQLVDNTFDNPVYVTGAPGASSSNLLFVVEQPGVIQVLVNEVKQATPFLDITDRVLFGGERGLLSVAFDPDYQTNRLFYVAYNNASGDVEIDEFRRVADNPRRANPGTRRRVLVIPHRDASNHNGGQLQFGPDGLLYISIGDGGSTPEKARMLNSLLGKVLRINPARQGNRPYTIPSSNPFAGQANRRGEIFLYGLRNPWRFSFDGNRIAIADVGQQDWEEINFLAISNARGGNFGWPHYEGRAVHDASQPAPQPLKFPMHVYSHNNGGCAVIGGYVSHDASVPGTLNKYLYGDLCTGHIFILTPNFADNRPAAIRFTGITRVNLSSFGIGPNNRIYFTQTSGQLSKIVAP